jgi:hypothetical protein
MVPSPKFKAEFGDLLRKEYPNIKIKNHHPNRIPKPMPFWKECMDNWEYDTYFYQVENINLDEDDPFEGLVLP